MSGHGDARRVARGTPAYRRIGFALFFAGFSTFSLLYCVQPLLPEFARYFRLSPAASALALSLTTALLAVAIVASGAASGRFDRRKLMFASMAAAAVLNIVCALAPSWGGLLLARGLEGLLLGGVPAVAMTYLAEEIDPTSLGRAMGRYVAGTAFGGMAGRVGMGVLTELTSWRVAMAVLGLVGLLLAAAFILLLPPSRGFTPSYSDGVRAEARVWMAHLSNPALLRVFMIGFALMSVFVTIFNYAGFRLSQAPYHLGQTAISLVFLLYALGMVGSAAAGALTDRLGPRPVLIGGVLLLLAGVLATLATSVPMIVAGVGLVTAGFFIAHAVASGWVGRLAGTGRGQAASLYLLFYYAGSSLTGAAGGWAWEHGGWSAVVSLTTAMALLAVALAASIGRPRASECRSD